MNFVIKNNGYTVEFTPPIKVQGPYVGAPKFLHRLGAPMEESKLVSMDMGWDQLPDRFFVEPVSVTLDSITQETWDKFASVVDLTMFSVTLVVKGQFVNTELGVSRIIDQGIVWVNVENLKLRDFELETNVQNRLLNQASSHKAISVTFAYEDLPNIHTLSITYISDYSLKFIDSLELGNIKTLNVERGNNITYEHLAKLHEKGIREMNLEQGAHLSVHDQHKLTEQMPGFLLRVDGVSYLGKDQETLFGLL